MNTIMHNHFNRINKKYFKNIGDKKNLYEDIKKTINPLIKDKIILDIGSGGHIFYDHNLSKKIFVLDISQEMLNSMDDKNLIKINQDARNMSKVKDKTIDIVLIIFALHHINGSSYKESIKSLKKTLYEVNNKLTDKGELFIIEPVLNKFLFVVEKLFYKIIFLILQRFKTDMVFFYNQRTIQDNLLNIFKDSSLNITKIKMTGWFDPLLGTFPGLIKIPAFLMPTSMKCFYLQKIK